MREIMQRGVRPALARLYDSDETRRAMPGEQGAGCALFLACEGPQEIADAEAGVCREIIHKFGGRGLGSGPVHGWLDQRYDYSAVQGALSRTGGYAETIEVAHFWSEIATLYAELRRALAPLANEVFGHFSHFYPQGASLYVILLGQAPDDETAAARLNDIWRTAMEVTIACGGELSHHHGIGLVRQQFLARSLGPGHDLLRRLKHALDPSGLLSPGKLGL
jgi:alkyldihydroxyacetonephosphate synthase